MLAREVTHLVARAQAGDRNALELAVAQLSPLAHRIAADYYAPGMERDDLRQEALIGLAHAVRDYDGRGALVSFAALCIRRRVQTAVTFAHRRKHEHLNRAECIDAPTRDGEALTLAEMLPSGQSVVETLEQREDVQALRALPDRLSDIEAGSLAGFLNGQDYDTIAQALGTDRKSVDNALTRARKKARALVAA